MNKTMQAVGFQKYGGAEVLETLQLPMPSIKSDELLIRIVATGVNPSDPLFRSGGLKYFVRIKLPFVPGLDVAGVIEDVGTNVNEFQRGDAVYAMLPNTTMGGYAEYVAVAATSVAHAPENLTFSETAALPCAALTALQALRDDANLTSDTKILINGASGGVGSFAVQIAKALGAYVTATCSTKNVEFVRTLGADEVIDYTQTDIPALTTRYDVIFDADGTQSFATWKVLLNRNGIMVTVNPILGNPILKFLSRFDGQGRRLKSLLVKPSGADLHILNQWVLADKLKPVIDASYPLEQAADAHRYSETKRVRGKLVLIVDQSLANQKTLT